jgi:peptidoglycan hydrolase-like protein with peptidoglycan-binding domain
MHVSVHSTKANYDNEKPWDIGAKVTPHPPEAGPDLDNPKNRPIVRRGDKGELVREIQTLTFITVDGDFGPVTEGAVKSFQSRRDLKPDGIVGPVTWAAFDKIEQRHNGEDDGDALEDVD